MISLVRGVCFVSLVAATACSTGPAGPEGPTGPTGPQGSAAPDAPAANTPAGTVYTLSNDATANAVFAFDRAADGTLVPHDVYPTGGIGTGAELGVQGALAYSPTSSMLFGVNAGDNSISSFAVAADGSLGLISKISSGGVMPVSITTSGELVYVVNAGTTGTAANISGFTIAAGGLSALSGSTQPLSTAAPGPAEIAFSPNGGLLIVTEKGTNKIDSYVVSAGIAAAPRVQSSVGTTPFGFAFDSGGQLVVSEAFGGAAGASAASSYSMAADTGQLTPVSSSVPSAQSAACWVTVVGSHAYASNTASNDVSIYAVAGDGTLTLAAGDGASTGNSPIDSAATTAGDFLYVHNIADASLSFYAVAGDGTLTKGTDFGGLPQQAAGLIAR